MPTVGQCDEVLVGSASSTGGPRPQSAVAFSAQASAGGQVVGRPAWRRPPRVPGTVRRPPGREQHQRRDLVCGRAAARCIATAPAEGVSNHLRTVALVSSAARADTLASWSGAAMVTYLSWPSRSGAAMGISGDGANRGAQMRPCSVSVDGSAPARAPTGRSAVREVDDRAHRWYQPGGTCYRSISSSSATGTTKA